MTPHSDSAPTYSERDVRPLRNGLTAIMIDHAASPPSWWRGPKCQHCWRPFPCPTRRTAAVALGSDPHAPAPALTTAPTGSPVPYGGSRP